MQTLFTRRFGPGGALAAEDVGLKPLNGGVRFDPEVLRIAFQNPQKVERFFTRKHVPRDAMLMPMIIPPQISGTTHVRLTFQDQKIKVFLGSTRGDTKDTADPDKVQWTEGRLQEGVIVGKEHTAFEGMHLCLTTQAQEGLKKLQKEGDTLLTTLDTQAGFADDLLWTLTRYASEFQKTGQAHDARVAQGAQKITDIQKAIDQKRDQIKPGAARLQVAYVQAKMREKMNSQLMKSLWKGDGEG